MEEILTIFNEKGEPKSKEDFIKNAEAMYDLAIQNFERECGGYLDALLDGSTEMVDPDTALQRFDFFNRSIYITEEITHETGIQVYQLINFWNKVDRTDNIENPIPIKIYIDTPGGDIEATLSIISSIKASRTPVYTYTIGNGFSAGFFIGICGHKRFGAKYSSYLYHGGTFGDIGDVHKVFQRSDFYHRQLALLKEIVLENTKITEAEYDSHYKDDWFMLSEEALKYGVIDEILTKDTGVIKNEE